MSDLLTQYNVTFYKENLNGYITHTSRGGGLANFLDHFQDLDNIADGLANVQYYIEKGTDDYEKCTVSGELYTVWLDNETADIYPSTGNTEHLLQSIPLTDFHDILRQWLNFIKN